MIHFGNLCVLKVVDKVFHFLIDSRKSRRPHFLPCSTSLMRAEEATEVTLSFADNVTTTSLSVCLRLLESTT